MGSLKTMSGGLLLGLCLTLLGWGAEGQWNGRPKKEISGSGPINLGQQQRGTWWPLMQTRENLTEVKSIKSMFQFRTFDPEGVVFYGDTREGEDWFVLILRNGIPEMQIGKADILVSVQGGPKLNDGKWHLVEISSQGDFVVLEVDGQKGLVVGLKSKETVEVLTGQIRLALGGILVSLDKLLIPFQPEMDGCIQKGNWLNLSTPWETEMIGEPWPCYQNIQPGSYFPGAGLAAFNTTDLPGHQTEESGITIDIHGDSTKMEGTVLSLKTSGQELPTVTVKINNDPKKVILTILKRDTVTEQSFSRLSLTLLKNQVNMDIDDTHLTFEIDNIPDFPRSWKEGMILAFGGLPGDGVSYSSIQYLKGCLEKIQVQGQDVDLDRALYKDLSISSHSCPSEV
uniref:Sex hormone-binding globulin n=1 Tax=Hucho hucho TaxID=62062 RepID=A0A4W5JC82_9TELE